MRVTARGMSAGYRRRLATSSSFLPARPAVQGLVQVDGGADQGQVSEGLGEIAERLARVAYLLREQAQVVAVGEHLLEDAPGLVRAAGPGQGLDVPERAEAEGALAVGDAVVAGDGVPVDQAVGDQLVADPLQRGQEARVGRSGELDPRH